MRSVVGCGRGRGLRFAASGRARLAVLAGRRLLVAVFLLLVLLLLVFVFLLVFFFLFLLLLPPSCACNG